MLKIFYADLRNTLHHRGFLLCSLSLAGYLIAQALILWLILTVFMKESGLNGETIADAYESIAAIVITACTLSIFSGDYSNGIIRNKLISGSKRRDIILSAITCGALIGVMLCAIYVVVTSVLVLIFSEGWTQLTISEIADSFLVSTLASAAIGAFTAMLVMVLGGSKTAYVVGLLGAFAFRLMNMAVCEKLYPEKGVCTLQGMKLTLYRAYDRFMPYSHLSLYTRWPFSDYLIGSTVMIVLSMVFGILLFEKKEIK